MMTGDIRDRGRAVPLVDELATLDDVRNSTLVVYSLLRCSGPLTIAEITESTGFSANTVSRSFAKLREDDLLAETSAPSGVRANRQYFIDPGSLSFL